MSTIDGTALRQAFSRPMRRLRRNGARVAILLGAGVLGGCPLTSSQWVEAPLLADAVVTDYATSAQYSHDNAAGLPLKQGDQLLVKFSLATLPNGNMPAITVANQQASYNSGFNYSLTANKVVHARLVLYVTQLNQAGYLGITPLPGTNCWPKGNAAPTCAAGSASASNPANPDVRGMDADNAANPIKATTPGYISFDVTAAVKAWIANPASNNGLQIRTFADPVDSSHGNFVFAGLEAADGGVVPHRPQLLVTVSDLIGQAGELTTTYVDEALPTSNFNGAPQLLLDGSSGAHAFALLRRVVFDSPTDNFDSVGVVVRDGTALKATVTSYIPTAPLDQTTTPSRLNLFASDDFNPATITYGSWNAPASVLFPVNAVNIDPTLPAQVVVNDGSWPHVQKLIATYNQDRNLHMPPFVAALTTNLQQPLPLENAAQRRARMVYAAYGVQGAPVDTNDDTYAHVLKFSSAGQDNRSLRLGQSLWFSFQMEYQIDANNVDRLGNAIGLFAPASGASVTMSAALSPPAQYVGNQVDIFPDGTEQSGSAGVQMKAVGATGSYVVYATAPGHNTRLQVHLTNLPLPVPSLAGPAQVAIPVGQTQASGAFTLNVNDPVNANIDDTTKWLFSSSVAGDTLPGEMQQTNGSQGFSATFHSSGTRRITVTSKGDPSVKAWIDVLVSDGERIFANGFD